MLTFIDRQRFERDGGGLKAHILMKAHILIGLIYYVLIVSSFKLTTSISKPVRLTTEIVVL